LFLERSCNPVETERESGQTLALALTLAFSPMERKCLNSILSFPMPLSIWFMNGIDSAIVFFNYRWGAGWVYSGMREHEIGTD